MAKRTKKQQQAHQNHDFSQLYALGKGIQLLQQTHTANFDASVDAAVNLGIDPKNPAHMVRGIVALPHGTGKVPRVLALCTPDKEQEARDAGADHVGLDSYLSKIAQGWLDFDILVTMPNLMVKVAKLGKVLGPRGLMPNPKTGTVTLAIGQAIQEIKAGKVPFKADKAGIVHLALGRVSFAEDKLRQNIQEFIEALKRLKPSAAKGSYLKALTLSTTMGAGVRIDLHTLTTP